MGAYSLHETCRQTDHRKWPLCSTPSLPSPPSSWVLSRALVAQSATSALAPYPALPQVLQWALCTASVVIEFTPKPPMVSSLHSSHPSFSRAAASPEPSRLVSPCHGD